MIADETIGVFGENTSLGSIDDVIVAVLGGGGGERERGRRQASIGRIAPKKSSLEGLWHYRAYRQQIVLTVFVRSKEPRKRRKKSTLSQCFYSLFCIQNYVSGTPKNQKRRVNRVGFNDEVCVKLFLYKDRIVDIRVLSQKRAGIQL